MLTLKCKACGAPMNANHWVESIQDYNDLCGTCLEAIGYSVVDPESLSFELAELLEDSDEEEDNEYGA